MKFITDKIQWTDSMKEYGEEIFNKKMHRLSIESSDAIYTLSKIGSDVIKITLTVDGVDNFRAQDTGKDFYKTMSKVTDKVKKLMIKHKDKYCRHADQIKLSSSMLPNEEVDNVSLLIAKEKNFELHPISIDEAIEQFEKTDYNFFVFRDLDVNNIVSIIYKRLDNKYGLIRCQ